MKKLYCFYSEKDFLVSADYTRLTCHENLYSFLKEIHENYADKMKVVQINFEALHQGFERQKALYPAAIASVFLLNSYQILSEAEVLNDIRSATDADFIFEPLEIKSAFIEKVNIIKKEISAGRIYQVNLTAPLKAKSNAEAESVFKKFYSAFKGHYKVLLPIGESTDVVSFSPELFLEKQGHTLTTRPIKGSLKSGSSFENDLLKDSKEDAELSMIVDLLRNDLNRVEPAQSAKVTQHRSQMELGYIQHTYSEIQIHTEKSLPEILECTFPGGSVSGCPKLESLSVISELEPYKRQVYTGTIGWWKDMNFSLNLAIRTFVKHEDTLFYHAGCGIVFDSAAEKEWAEFILKTGKINAVFR